MIVTAAPSQPTVSLIVATVDRTDTLAQLLSSLTSQDFEDFEVLVVDQNPDDRLVPILEGFGHLRIRHLRSARGLSRARNVGLRHATGRIVAFPDDDCSYPSSLLSTVVGKFEADPGLGGVCGVPYADDGTVPFGRFLTTPGTVTRNRAWRQATSIGLFLMAAEARSVGGFDEQLGLGSGTPWGSSEDVDLPLRMLAAGERLAFDPCVAVHHPHVTASYGESQRRRASSYAAGQGRVLSKHDYPWWYVGYQLARPVGGALLAVARGDLPRARHHASVAIARGRAYFQSRR